MIKRLMLMILPALSCAGSIAQKTGSVYSPGPYEVVVDAKSLRSELGYSWMNISDLSDTILRRQAAGIHLKAEFKILSYMVDKYSEFVVYDAFYFGLQLGKIQTETIGENLPVGDISREGKFMSGFQFGYDVYLGYRNKYWGVLAGVRPQWQYANAGDFSIAPTAGGFDLLRFSYPVALRTEWRPFAHFEYRIIASAWKSFNREVNQSGVRLELPTIPSKRFWIFFEYQIQRAPWLYLSTAEGNPAAFKSWLVGLRVGSLM
jgi:hypothetical protein